jgi:hypothetical protein
MSALDQLTVVLLGLPMDAEGRKACDDLISAAEREQQELVQALRESIGGHEFAIEQRTTPWHATQEFLGRLAALLSRFEPARTP